MSTRVYHFDELSGFVYKVAREVASKSRMRQMQDDIAQELWLWLLENRAKVEEWLAEEPQRTSRLYWTLRQQGFGLVDKEREIRREAALLSRDLKGRGIVA